MTEPLEHKPAEPSTITVDGLARWAQERRALLFWVARSVLGNDDDSADAVQEALVRVASAIQRGAVVKHPQIYLMRAVRNAALDLSGTRERSAHAMRETTHTAAPVERLIAREDGARLTGCIEKLPEPLRAVILLKYREEVSSEEICEALEISAEAFWQRHSRALRLLRHCVAEGVS